MPRNICRSPLAEAAFRAEAERLGLDVEIDSAGTADWNVGQPPDSRAQAVARKHGLDIGHLRARHVSREDFHRYDYMLAMDRKNLAELRRLQPQGSRAQLSLLLDREFGRPDQPVGDPYHGGTEVFEQTWQYVAEGARALALKLAGSK